MKKNKKKKLVKTKEEKKSQIEFKDLFSNFFKQFDLKQWVLIIVPLIIGSLLRGRTIFTSGFWFDTIGTQYRWGEAVIKNGLTDVWNMYFIDYTPGGVLLDAFFYVISRPFADIIGGFEGQEFVTVAKVFYWVFEIALVVVLYRLLRRTGKYSKNISLLICGYAYLTPIFWIVSTFWGQMDTFIAFWGIVLTILFATLQSYSTSNRWYKNLFFWTGFLFGIIFTIKMHIFIFIPTFLLLLYFDKTIKESLKFVLSFATSIIFIAVFGGISYFLYLNLENTEYSIIVLFFLFFGALIFLLYRGYKKSLDQKFLISIGFVSAFLMINVIPVLYNPAKSLVTYAGFFLRGHNISSGASTFWSLFPFSGNDSRIALWPGVLNLSVEHAGLIILIIVLSCILLIQNKLFITSLLPLDGFDNFVKKFVPKKFTIVDAFLFSSIFMSAYFLLMMNMHSRYLIFGAVTGLFAYAMVHRSKSSFVYLIGVLLLHIGFTFNQIGVYTAWYGSSDLHGLTQYLPLWLSAWLNVSGFLLMLSYYIYYYLKLPRVEVDQGNVRW